MAKTIIKIIQDKNFRWNNLYDFTVVYDDKTRKEYIGTLEEGLPKYAKKWIDKEAWANKVDSTRTVYHRIRKW